MKVDITSKLNFEEKPELIIKGETYKVNNEATTFLKLTPLMENPTPEAISKAYELIFDESEREKLEKLKLSFTDFQTIITEAIKLVVGDTQGEAVTPAMT